MTARSKGGPSGMLAIFYFFIWMLVTQGCVTLCNLSLSENSLNNYALFSIFAILCLKVKKKVRIQEVINDGVYFQ